MCAITADFSLLSRGGEPQTPLHHTQYSMPRPPRQYGSFHLSHPCSPSARCSPSSYSPPPHELLVKVQEEDRRVRHDRATWYCPHLPRRWKGREIQSVLQSIFVIAFLLICYVASFISSLDPSSPSSASSINRVQQEGYFAMRGAASHFTTSVADALPSAETPPLLNLIAPTQSMPLSSVTHPSPPNPQYVGSLQTPLPTHAWWYNFVSGNGDQQAVALPYAYKATEQGLGVSYSPWRRVVTDKAVCDIFFPDWTFSVNLTSSADMHCQRGMLGYDSLTAHLGYNCDEDNRFDFFLAKGSPYTTVHYHGEGARPKLLPLGAVSSVNGIPVSANSSFTVKERKFTLVLASGSTWLLYAESEVEFQVVPSALTAIHFFQVSHLPSRQ